MTKALRNSVTLHNLDLRIKKGEFVVIVGDASSGKSSLFNAIMNEMIYLPEEEIRLIGGLDK